MNKELIAAITFLAALVGTLGSLFLAYDYLDPGDVNNPESSHDNPLRFLLRIVVPIVGGILPGVLVLVLFSTLQINNFQYLDVIIHVIALGALAGVASAWFIGNPDDSRAKAKWLTSLPVKRRISFNLRTILGRATIGLILGAVSGFIAALAVHTTVDNAITTAGATGPITMALYGVWPLIGWNPTIDETAKSLPSSPHRVSKARELLPGVAVMSFFVGLVNGLFNSRALQNFYSCVNANVACDKVSTPPAILGIGATALINSGVFLIGGVAASLVWSLVERVLIYLWDHVFARSPKVFGIILTTFGAGLCAVGMYEFMSAASPTTFSNHLLFLFVFILVLVVSIVLGFLVPIQPIRVTLIAPAPFSRYDATMMTCFAFCVLLPYIVLTNFGDLFSMLLGFPHALGPQTVPPIQFQRIVFYSEAALLLGIPVALGVGGLTRSVYQWAKRFPHKRLGAVGIALLFVAFILQLTLAFAGLVTT